MKNGVLYAAGRLAILAVLTLNPVSAGEMNGTSLGNVTQTFSRANNDVGTELLVSLNGRRYIEASGWADREKKLPMRPDMPFEIGSATKVFTGVAIFQLIEEGKLSLDTPLVKFYPKGKITAIADYKGKGYWDKVTVGMLLHHTSGIVDYLNVYDDATAMKVFGKPGVTYDLDSIVDLVVEHGDMNFVPGARHEYCNTGFYILGDLIEKITGMDWRDYVQKNILDKAGMKRTWFGTRLPESVKKEMPVGYAKGKPVRMPYSLAGSAGEIVSTLEDLEKFMRAWGEGKLYTKRSTLETQLKEGFFQHYKEIRNIYYGYAIMKIEGWYGHGGQTFGFQSFIAYKPENGAVVIAATNDSGVWAMTLFTRVAGIEYDEVVPLKKK
jgi:D-alanyl-D-alanine carboxypeptidase